MKILIKFSIIFLLVLISISCTKNKFEERVISNFPIEQNLKGRNTKIKMYCPVIIDIIDTNLLIVDICSDDAFHVFNLKTLEKIGSFGSKGKGPNEFVSPQYFGQNKVTQEGSYIFVFDDGKLSFSKVDIGKALQGNDFITEEIKVPYELGAFSKDILMLNNGWFVGTSMSGNGTLGISDESGNQTKWIDDFPDVDYLIPEDVKQIIYQSVIAMKPDGSRLVIANISFKYILVYNTNGDLEFRTKFTKIKTPKFYSMNDLMQDDTRNYYTCVYANDEYFFALDCNQTILDFKKGSKSKSRIEVYSWDGQSICLLNLDSPARYFTIDEETNTIYAVTLTTNSQIRRYKYIDFTD